MKAKPKIDDFLSGGAVERAEGGVTASAALGGEQADLVKITKTIRLSRSAEALLKEAAYKRSAAAGRRVTESDLIEQAILQYLKQ